MSESQPLPESRPPSGFDAAWAAGWTGVFLLNLPIPVLLGREECSQHGLIGMAAGIVLVWWVGLILCGMRFRVGRSLVAGGFQVALFQLVPIGHIAAGELALKLWRNIDSAKPLGPLGAFAVVLLTAQPLCLIAVLLGAGIRARSGDVPIWWSASHTADPDAEG